jgi:hypothetical protein
MSDSILISRYDPTDKCPVPSAEFSAPVEQPLKLKKLPEGTPRIAWFFAMNYEPSEGYVNMVKSVVVSARVKAPNLDPHFMYVLTPQQHKQYLAKGKASDEVERWMQSFGVTVIMHVVSFAERRGMNKQIHAQWARLDLFKIAKEMKNDFKEMGLITSHVLYTDMDLFFAKPFPMPGKNTELQHCGTSLDPNRVKEGQKPKGPKGSKCFKGGKGQKVDDPNWPYIFGAGTEVFNNFGVNTGVMLMNVENASKYFEPLVESAAKGNFNFATADQQCIEHFFLGGGGDEDGELRVDGCRRGVEGLRDRRGRAVRTHITTTTATTTTYTHLRTHPPHRMAVDGRCCYQLARLHVAIGHFRQHERRRQL